MRLLLLLLVLCWAGCSGTAPERTPGMEALITVEGRVSVRGNEPFSAVVLETDQHNFYVLALDEATRASLVGDLPARYRVTGVLYGAEWSGRRYAHLRPTLLERQ